MEALNSLQGQTFKDFQLSASLKDKKDDGYGKIVAKHFSAQVYGADSYIVARNARFQRNRKWANGRIDVQTMFQDRLELNGKTNYVNINWKALSLVNTIVSRLVGRWMARNEKISVTATDTLSIEEKNKEYQSIEFELQHRQSIQELQQDSGVPLTPQDQFKPADVDQLELWRAELQRLPEEILYEMNCNDALAANGWYDVLKEKVLHDSAVAGLVGSYTWMDNEGVIHVEAVKPENAIYSYSEYPDFRDTEMRGRVKSLKITELRKQYSKEFGGKLTEEEIFKIAATAKEYQNYDKLSWADTWNFSYFRPYDTWNVDVMEFEVKSLDAEGYTITQTKANGSTLVKKGKPEKIRDNQEYVEDKKWNIYRGVYIKGIDVLLEWGIKSNMIRPQDPKEIGNCEFSYSFYMYQNYDMRNLAVPEKIEEPVEQMILTRLKMQQLVAKMKPAGAAINVDAMQELDLGLAEVTTPWKAKQIWEQTGDFFYRGRDAEGNPIPVPMTELANSGFAPQMKALIELYQFHFGVLKDELGEDPNLITQAATPRVTEGNIQTSMQIAEFSTGYIYQAYVSLMEETSKKMACLMKDSVKYGSSAYRHIMDAKDIGKRVFGTKIQMLPNDAELQQLQSILNQSIASTPDLVMYMDSFKIMRVARENIKLAEAIYQNSMKKMLQSKVDQASKNAQENAQVQMQSAQAKSQGDAQLAQMQSQIDMQKSEADTKSKKEVALLTSIMAMYQQTQLTGAPIPTEIQPLASAFLINVGLPVAIENQDMRQAVGQQMQQQQASAMQQQQPEQGDPQQAGQQQSDPQQQDISQQQPEMAA